MWWCLLLINVASWASGTEINMEVETNAPLKFLVPPDDGDMNTTWILTVPQGSKLIVGCVTDVFDCNKLRFYEDDGNGEKMHCGERNFFSFSLSGMMRLTHFSTIGPHRGYCQVSATLPYLNDTIPDLDSSEDGTFAGKKPTSCRCGWANRESGSRIVNGEETLPNQFPFPVLILTGDHTSRFCGGSIISPYHIISAAHCTYNRRGTKLAIWAGAHDITKYSPYSQVIDVDHWYEHPDYDEVTKVNDITIMVLTEQIQFNDHVGPICLPKTDMDLTGEYVKVMGWGFTSQGGIYSDYLREVTVKVLNHDICNMIYSAMDSHNSQVCTFARDRSSCQGDSGGPVVWLSPDHNRYFLKGLVSYSNGCAKSDPSVSTNVGYYIKWIEDIIKKTKPQEICS